MVCHAAPVGTIAGVFILFSTLPPTSLQPTIEITSSLEVPTGEAAYVCQEESVNFTCVIRQSQAPIITWIVNTTSQQVNDLNNLHFINGYRNIKAVLTHVGSLQDGVYAKLESKLIITNYNYSTTKIQCSTENERISESITLKLLGNTTQYAAYYGLQKLNKHECRLYIFWSSLNSTGHQVDFMVYDNEQFLLNKASENNLNMTISVISYRCSCEYEITNSLTIKSQCDSTPISSFALLEGLEEPIPSHSCPLVKHSSKPTTDTVLPTNGAHMHDTTLIVGITVPLLTVIMIAVIIISNIITYIMTRRHLKGNQKPVEGQKYQVTDS